MNKRPNLRENLHIAGATGCSYLKKDLFTIGSTFPFLSRRLISTLSRCQPGLTPRLSWPIRIFSITSPNSSSCTESRAHHYMNTAFSIVFTVVNTVMALLFFIGPLLLLMYVFITIHCYCTSTINMSSAPLSKYILLSLLFTHRDFCWVHTASRPYSTMKTSASVPAPNMSLVKILIS